MPQEIKNASMQECIDLCFNCQKTCLETIQYCLTKGGAHAEASHIELLRNCASLCQTSSEFMISNSELQSEVCSLCANVCERCADSCSEIANDDAQMKECADACRKCAAECRSMGKMDVSEKSATHEQRAH